MFGKDKSTWIKNKDKLLYCLTWRSLRRLSFDGILDSLRRKFELDPRIRGMPEDANFRKDDGRIRIPSNGS